MLKNLSTKHILLLYVEPFVKRLACYFEWLMSYRAKVAVTYKTHKYTVWAERVEPDGARSDTGQVNGSNIVSALLVQGYSK
jgi:hypothetical protein